MTPPVTLTTSRAAPASPSSPVKAQILDVSDNPRIKVVMQMVDQLSRASDPRQVLRVFSEGLVLLDGPRGYVSLSVRNLAPGEYKITRFHNTDSVMDVDAADPWKNWDQMPTHRGGFFGEIIKKPWPQLMHHLELRNDPVVGNSLSHYKSMMAIPLFENGQPLNWSIRFKQDPQGYTVQDLEESILQTNLGGATVRNVMTTQKLRDANATIRREVEQIAKIQRALLPEQLPHVPGLSIAASYETYDTAGGDLYDLIVLPTPESGPTRFDGCLAMIVADASGHGPSSAVLAAMLNTLIYAYPRRGDGPGAVFEFANRHLHSKKIDGTFVTAFLAVYDPRDRTLIYANAGHNPPLIKNQGSGGSVVRVDQAGGIPLGIDASATYESATVQLTPGQTLVMYTDGITESMSPQRRMFGVDGIERSLHECSGEPDCVVKSITAALRAHEAGLRPNDDQTIVAVKVL